MMRDHPPGFVQIGILFDRTHTIPAYDSENGTMHLQGAILT
jgi:hypothetical protein